jgi:hypothetical protein
MTKEDITRMAREAQMPFYWRTGEITYLDKLERFAKLVAQYEREACAKLCEKWTPTDADGVCDVADAIRERGQA